MIFVTVGMHYQGFERLISKMDSIAETIDEDVIMQIGSTSYIPKNAMYFNFTNNYNEILDYFKEARIIISHAGAGTLIDAVITGRPIVVVPRLKRFGEIIDDQQLELAEVLSAQKKIIAVYDIKKLEKIVTEIEELNACTKKDDTLVSFLEKHIQGLNKWQ